MNTGAKRFICRHCSRFNPGSRVCRWCGVNEPYGPRGWLKVFADVKTPAERARQRVERFGPQPSGYAARQAYWKQVKEAGL